MLTTFRDLNPKHIPKWINIEPPFFLQDNRHTIIVYDMTTSTIACINGNKLSMGKAAIE
jgi:hypothetical protein